MKSLFTRPRMVAIAAIVCVFSFLPRGYASHAVSIDLTYKCVGNNLYVFGLHLYRDGCGIGCSSIMMLTIESSCGISYTTLDTVSLDTSIAINTFCSSIGQSATCCNGGTYPCYFESIYSSTRAVYLPACTSWKISIQEPSRNNAIQNFIQASSTALYAELNINNAGGVIVNSSNSLYNAPIITGVINQPCAYNPLVQNPDQDSLVFSFVSPQTTYGAYITYTSPFTFTHPFPSSTPIMLNAQTGEISFTPSSAGVYGFAVLLSRYRNGILITSQTRDIQLLIVPNTTAVQSVVSMSSISVNGGCNTGNHFETSVGSAFSFATSFASTDSTASLSLTTNLDTAIPGATISSSGVNPLNIVFNWNTANVTSGVYHFIVQSVAHSCPVESTFGVEFTIQVISLTGTVNAHKICRGVSNSIQLNPAGPCVGCTLGTFVWTPSVNLNNPYSPNPVANVSQPVTYTVNYTHGSCLMTRDVVVATSTASLHLGQLRDTVICNNGYASLSAYLPVLPYIDTLRYNIPTPVLHPLSIQQPKVVNIPILVDYLHQQVLDTASVQQVINSICVDITLSRISSVSITLIAPTGQSMLLSANNGGLTSNYDHVCFSTSATIPVTNYVSGPIPANAILKPQGSWSSLAGANLNGTWTIQIIHSDTSGFNGVLNSVKFILNVPNQNYYSWTPTNGLLSCYQCANPDVYATSTTRYHVSVENMIGCMDTASVTVYVQNYLPAPQVICTATTAHSVSFGWQPIPTAISYEVSVNGGIPINVGNVLNYTANGVAIGDTIHVSIIAISSQLTSCGDSPAGLAYGVPSYCTFFSPTIVGRRGFCNGDTISLETAYYSSYMWSTGATTQSIRVTNSGLYSVSAMDSIGCIGVDTFTLYNYPAPTPVIIGAHAVCIGQSNTISVSNNVFQSYRWSNGSSLRHINTTADGSYYLTVTNAYGCPGSDSFSFHFNSLPHLCPDSVVQVLNTNSVTLDAGEYSIYHWSNGSHARAISVNFLPFSGQSNPVVYNLIVVDSNQCTGSGMFSVFFINDLNNSKQNLFTGTDTFNEQDHSLLVSPNPFSDKAHFVFPSVVRKAVFTVYDSQGREVRKEQIENAADFVLERGALSAGLYIFRCKDESGRLFTGKMAIVD